jgi:RNA polymerase sigma factor (sigma-70 family)
LGVGVELDRQWSSRMAAAQAGDGAAYERLLREILPFVRSVLRQQRVRPDQVEDVVQDTLLTIHRVRHTYDPGRPFVGWLAAIAQRRAIDARRRSTRISTWEHVIPDQLETFPDPAANSQSELEDRRKWLHRALGDLPRKQRKAVELVKIRGLSVAEAAVASGQSAGAIKVNVHRALKALRVLFRED